jgi:predicted N-acyltransferase
LITVSASQHCRWQLLQPPQVPEEGWGPQHVIVRNDDTGELLGCCPLYLKGHSQGEYVFDSSWANYSHMMGKR